MVYSFPGLWCTVSLVSQKTGIVDNFFGLYCVLTNGTMDTIQSRTKEQAQMDHRELFDQRNHIVVKDNDLVRARYNLTVNQQKIIAYIISLIKPEDKEMKMYEISISDYCELCGIEKDYFYQDIKDVIKRFLSLDG